MGSPREGDELVRNGRTGAFTFNLAAIKNHSVTTAATVLRQLESCYDEHAAAMVINHPDQEVRDAVGTSTMLDVHRMVARQRGDRNALVARLDNSLQQIRHLTTHNGETPPTDRALRFAINAAATTKLTDLTVTPRELRSILGLA